MKNKKMDMELYWRTYKGLSKIMDETTKYADPDFIKVKFYLANCICDNIENSDTVTF